MVGFPFDNVRRILCLGAHSDDIEIGCGGTLLKLARERPDIHVTWIVFSGQGPRAREARASARTFLKDFDQSRVVLKQFKISFFPYQAERIKSFFEQLKKVEPDLVFTHYRDDRHQDHRVLSDLAWNTWRNHLILEYEIPKYDGDLGCPNMFVPLSKQMAEEKVGHISRFFQTQSNKHWFEEQTFLSLMRLRGMECAAQYAESFYSRKVILGAPSN